MNEYEEKLRTMLSPDRFRHSVGVAQTAVRLAERYNADREKAYLAGILHDAAKNFSYEEMLDKCAEYNIELDEISKSSKGLMHGPLGAEIVRRDFGVDDEEVYSCIFFHTTGKPDMTLLEKIIYIADMTEPNRKFEGVEKLRMMTFENLDKSLLMGFDSTIIHTVQKGELLNSATIHARNSIIKELKGQVYYGK